MPKPSANPHLSRRSLLAAGGAMLAFPNIVRAGTPGDTDIVIIGAGAAGLAAARVLKKRGIRFELIEIRDRIGGRAETNFDYFGVPVDFGCSELHNAKLNPWIGYARQNGVEIAPLPGGNSVFDGATELEGARARALKMEFERRQGLLKQACAARRDISVADVLAAAEPSQWTDAFNLWLGPVSAGIDLEDWSVLDWCASRAGQDWYAPGGFGALIAQFGSAIPVHLTTGAKEISWSGRSVKVDTDRGIIAAKAAIVTIPVSVLKSGSVKCTPALPNWKLKALEGMATAHYTKVLLKFRREIVDQPHGSWLAH
ncbi:MAG: NAD(P)-binding protein, partial [Rhizobiales bacterium]|nr:NAD(P)-binding protein [Hyphomicrobiales bacterium]